MQPTIAEHKSRGYSWRLNSASVLKYGLHIEKGYLGHLLKKG